MVKKTFNTLKKNPVILLGFALPILLTIAALIPMVSGLNAFIKDAVLAEAQGIDISDAEIISFMSNYFISFILLMFISTASMFLIQPPLLNKIYEVCSGNNDAGWYARGLKRSWWKLFVTTIIISALSSMLGFVIVLVIFVPFVGALLYAAVLLALTVFVMIAHTAVIAEDDFGNGLSSIFTVGFKYFFKQLGAVVVANLPIYVLAIAMTVVSIVKAVNLSYHAAAETEMLAFFNSFMPIVWIFVGVISLYTVFSTAFTYTYSMHSYVDKKAELNSNTQDSQEHTDI